MEVVNIRTNALREQIAAAEAELQVLKKELEIHEKEHEQYLLRLDGGVKPLHKHKWPLKAEEYQRYGRQMIVPSVGIEG